MRNATVTFVDETNKYARVDWKDGKFALGKWAVEVDPLFRPHERRAFAWAQSADFWCAAFAEFTATVFFFERKAVAELAVKAALALPDCIPNDRSRKATAFFAANPVEG